MTAKKNSIRMHPAALLMVTFLVACAPTVAILQPGADKVTVGKADPTDNFTLLGPISGVDGDGCGGFGEEGTYENAVTNLRNNASTMQADYAQIITISEPHLSGGCYVNLYRISANAYKKTKESPSPTHISNVTNATDRGIKGTLSEQLRELNELKRDGLLSEDEYQEQRKKILSK